MSAVGGYKPCSKVGGTGYILGKACNAEYQDVLLTASKPCPVYLVGSTCSDGSDVLNA